MCSLVSLPTCNVQTNLPDYGYRPRFFDLKEFNLKQIEFNSFKFSENEIERELLLKDFSFAYLKDGELRTMKVFDDENKLIPFESFLNRFKLNIKSTNIFKSGKYLSRVFRPVKYGKFYKGMDIYVNQNTKYLGKITDGLSLISIKLAKELGWTNVKPNSSALFTLLFKQGLVKGNCVVSDKIDHDVVIYTDDNIKKEISFKEDIAYISLEPLKLSKKLRLDIQSMLNMWELFGAEQYLSWAYKGIENYKKDLLKGKLADYLDDFNEIDEPDYDDEKWTLRKAIYHKVEYQRYPGLVRLGWSMFKNSLARYAEDINGEPVFRIPIPGGIRGYFRVDLRDHDKDGSFAPSLERGTIAVDSLGNIWIHPDDIEEFLLVKGGADLDDSAGIIPIEDGKAVVYRNPNQYGEYGIHKIEYLDIEVTDINKLVGCVPIKQINKQSEYCSNSTSTGNKLLDNFLSTVLVEQIDTVPYNIQNLIRTYNKIINSNANIGVAANAEMIRSSIGITNPEIFKLLIDEFNWDLEKIIDSAKKDGFGAEEDMTHVHELYNFIAEQEIEVPQTLISRFPEKLKNKLMIMKNHPVDELLSAIEYLVSKADIEVLGDGAVSSGKRIPGMIDQLDIPLLELGVNNLDNKLFDISMNILKGYNQSIAILLEKTSKLKTSEKETQRKTGIDEIQSHLLKKMNAFSQDERIMIVQNWAYEIYKTPKAVHDSILWIGDKEELIGTASDTIFMLANDGLAMQVKSDGDVFSRYIEEKKVQLNLDSIRLWSKEELKAEEFSSIDQIAVEGKSAFIGDLILNIGDECKIIDGIYKIKTVTQSVSRKNRMMFLKNSLTVYLTC